MQIRHVLVVVSVILSVLGPVHANPLPEGAVLQLGGHRLWHEEVNGAVFSADGKRLFTVGASVNGVRVFDAESQRLLAIWGKNEGLGRGIAISPDGKTIFTGDRSDFSIHLLDAETGKELRKISLPSRSRLLHHPLISPDGKWLAATRGAEGICVWNLTSGNLLHEFPAIGQADRFSSDSRWLLTTSGVWFNLNLKETKRSPTFENRSDYAVGAFPGSPEYGKLHFGPDGKFMISRAPRDEQKGDWKKHVFVLTTDEGGVKHRLEGHTAEVVSVRFSDDGKFLATSDGTDVRWWDLSTGKEQARFSGGGMVLAISPDRRRIAIRLASFEAGTFVIHQTEGAKSAPIPTGHTAAVRRIVYSPDGRFLATCAQDNTARIWDAKTGKELQVLKGHEQPIYGIAFTPEGNTLFTAAHDSTVREWDTSTGKGKVRIHARPRSSDDIDRSEYFWGVAVSHDGKTLAALNSNASWVFLLGPEDREPKRMRAHGRASQLTFSSRGMLAVGGEAPDGIIILDPADKEVRHQFNQNPSGQHRNEISYSSDGLLLAVANGGLTIFDAETQTAIRQFALPKGTECLGCAYSRTGRVIATSMRERVGLFETTTGEFRGYVDTMHGDRGQITSLAFSQDGRRVAVAYQDGTSLVWDIYHRGKPSGAIQPADLDTMWATMGEKATPSTHEAITLAIHHPKDAVPYLDSAMKKMLEFDERLINQWIRELDSDRFAVREKATKELIRIGIPARKPLEDVVKSSKSEEVRTRANRILETIGEKKGGVPTFTDELRANRVLEVLEVVADEPSKGILKMLSEKFSETPLGKDAKKTLARIEKYGGIGR